jgi:hypothetical protein
LLQIHHGLEWIERAPRSDGAIESSIAVRDATDFLNFSRDPFKVMRRMPSGTPDPHSKLKKSMRLLIEKTGFVKAKSGQNAGNRRSEIEP